MSFSSYFWKDTISIIAAFGKIEICFQFLDCYKNIKTIHNFCLSRNCLIVTILRVIQEKHHFETESFFFFENLVFGSRKVLRVNECCLDGASFANFYLKWEINKKIFKWTNKWTNKEREQRLSLGLSMF